MQDEKRSSYRYPIQDGFRSSILKLGRQELLVQMIEESAGGFSLSCTQQLNVKPGQTALLQNASGVYEVEIAHLTTHGDSTRIGLKRLGSVSRAQPPRTSVFSSIFGNGQKAGGMVSFVLFALLGASVTLLATGGFLPWGPGSKNVQTSGSYQLPITKPNGALHRGLVGLNTLTSEDIAQQLGLSKEQRRNIQNIFQETAQSLSEVYQNSGGDSAQWEQETTQLVEQAARQVVSSLTRDQLAEWGRILQENPPTEPTPQP